MEQLMCSSCGRTNVTLKAVRENSPRIGKKGKLMGYLCKICGGK